MKFNIMVFCALVAFCVASCATVQTSHAPRPAGGGPHLATGADEPLGYLNDRPIHRAEFDDSLQQKLRDNENESLQRQLHMLWVGFEETLANALIGQEAERRGVSKEALWQEEVHAKVESTTDDQVRDFFAQNSQMFEVPFEVVAPHIRRELERTRKQEQERAFVEKLRATATVRYSFPVPELPRFPMDLGEAPILGPKSAPITVVEFADYECPYCSRAKDVLMELKNLYPDKVRIVYRDFPLEQHANANAAAEAAHCAHEQNKFWPFHDLLYANTDNLTSDALRGHAETVKLNLSDYDACLASPRPRKAVQASLDAGARMGVQGTPAIYINGMKLIGLLPLPLLQTLVENELQRN